MSRHVFIFSQIYAVKSPYPKLDNKPCYISVKVLSMK